MKTCTKCGESKSLSEFGVRSSAKDGLSFQCKPCVRSRNKAYYLSDPGKSAAQRATAYQKNRGDLLQYRKDHYQATRDVRLSVMKAHRETNREAVRKRSREWVRNNRVKVNAYYRNKLKTDPDFRKKEALRGLLRASLLRMGTPKESRTCELLGYTAAQLGQRMEAQFQRGMDWSNYGEWQIDHKIPVAHFKGRGEFRAHVVNALCNLQPLWAADNLKKRDKLPTLFGARQ